MDSIREQMDLTNEISDAISNPVGMGQEVSNLHIFFARQLTRLPYIARRGRNQS